MIKCKICGHVAKYRLIEHIIKQHKITLKEYKEKYGDYITDEYRDRVSKKSKEKWKDTEYRNKTMNAMKYIYTDVDIRKKRSNTIKERYRKGEITVWNKGLTKDDDVRLKHIGEYNKQNLRGRTKEEYPYLMKHSKLIKKLWKNKNSNMTYATKCLSDGDILKWKEKISDTMSSRIADGTLNTMSNFKNGYYNSIDGEKYWYASLLELNAMKYFDVNKIKWTNKHGIRIKYFINDTQHYYVPDFLIEVDGIEYVIEMKGWQTEEVNIKEKYTRKIYGNKYFIIYSINELEDIINGICKSE